ncbi:hypothetical protein B0T26DRAFT_645189 [Lasiosphaeria miniovina]|uniref:Uncharacterized protein n=1 Tax=Lasiosphaeria miniovina TaxID=1954250 RepID=A0AA40DW33_9PEZI|nr:uncharacterized protein B0T26DRAFT_645189 [Lasiosphaeria miniovina]KAK0717770.1 hypothetical protein B0T26DRAFT_645189 [Lasiosphaeria miniovina]
MRSVTALSGLLCLALASTGTAQEGAKDGCPKDEIACHDIINGSQCLEQLIIEHNAPLTKEAMIKCVVHEGTASSLPGGTKVCTRWAVDY